ncbi:uncharacterized protein ARMOST_08165 [Armillaria ostoyae]|uniref:Uncharacterized protein n=1 Tax=Armillaria ostoyae TaxID=47428 RepID=A0A284R7T8_ARMOS|nr:uncharacterized protein ARMOST_08165 [Armillaria ostoyae]
MAEEIILTRCSFFTRVAQTYQNLQSNYIAMSASLLFKLVLVQRAITNGSSVDAISSSPLNSNITFIPPPLRPLAKSPFSYIYSKTMNLATWRIWIRSKRFYPNILNSPHPSNDVATTSAHVSHINERTLADYCERFVLVNEDSREAVGDFDKISVHEDPTIWERGHDKDSILIEVPAGQTVNDEHPLLFFVRTIPPDQHEWINKSAVIVSHAITHTTSLFLTVVDSTSSQYNHSAPSPYHPVDAKPGEDDEITTQFFGGPELERQRELGGVQDRTSLWEDSEPYEEASFDGEIKAQWYTCLLFRSGPESTRLRLPPLAIPPLHNLAVLIFFLPYWTCSMLPTRLSLAEIQGQRIRKDWIAGETEYGVIELERVYASDMGTERPGTVVGHESNKKSKSGSSPSSSENDMEPAEHPYARPHTGQDLLHRTLSTGRVGVREEICVHKMVVTSSTNTIGTSRILRYIGKALCELGG